MGENYMLGELYVKANGKFYKVKDISAVKVELEEKPSFQVVCVESISPYFTKGKVYSVVEGILLDDDNDPECPYSYIICRTVEEVNDLAYQYAKFIEYKGGADE